MGTPLFWRRRWTVAGPCSPRASDSWLRPCRRSANTDAIFTLLVLLTVVAVWVFGQPPLAFGVAGPISLPSFCCGAWRCSCRCAGRRLKSGESVQRAADSLPLCRVRNLCLPVAAWGIARWRLDGWRFFKALFGYDFSLERRSDRRARWPLVLLRHDPAEASLRMGRRRGGRVPALSDPVAHVRRFSRGIRYSSSLIIAWVAVTVMIPTVMRTKLPWYFNSFYPVFALGTAWLLVTACRFPSTARAVVDAAPYWLAWSPRCWSSPRPSSSGIRTTIETAAIDAGVAAGGGGPAAMGGGYSAAAGHGRSLYWSLLGADRTAHRERRWFHREQPCGRLLAIRRLRRPPGTDARPSNGRHWLYYRRPVLSPPIDASDTAAVDSVLSSRLNRHSDKLAWPCERERRDRTNTPAGDPPPQVSAM